MTTTDEIIQKHAEAAAEEIQAEERKTAQQREKETLSAELEARSTELKPLFKMPSIHGAKIDALVAEQERIVGRLAEIDEAERAEAKAKATQEAAANVATTPGPYAPKRIELSQPTVVQRPRTS